MSRIHEAVQLSRARERHDAVEVAEGASGVVEAEPAPSPRPAPPPDLTGPEDLQDRPWDSWSSIRPEVTVSGRTLPSSTKEPSSREQAAAELGRAIGERLMTHPDANPVVVDQFRKLAAVLHHAQMEHGSRTVTIASAVANEGKTLTAINLALTLAVSYGRRVLLIDADLRGSTVHTFLQCPRSPGLTDVVAGQTDTLPLAQVMPGLSILAAGTPTNDPITALSAGRFRQLLTEATTRFDWVILDMPPVGALPDVGVLTAFSDTTVLVVQIGAAPYQVVQRAAEAIGAERIIGVVLNMVPESELGATYGDALGYPQAEAQGPWFRRRLPRLLGGAG